jgi:hypothetical protein
MLDGGPQSLTRKHSSDVALESADRIGIAAESDIAQVVCMLFDQVEVVHVGHMLFEGGAPTAPVSTRQPARSQEGARSLR